MERETYYGAPRIDGLVALERYKIETTDELVPGDGVDVFLAPGGKFLISKNEQSTIQVDRVNAAYVSFRDAATEKGV